MKSSFTDMSLLQFWIECSIENMNEDYDITDMNSTYLNNGLIVKLDGGRAYDLRTFLLSELGTSDIMDDVKIEVGGTTGKWELTITFVPRIKRVLVKCLKDYIDLLSSGNIEEYFDKCLSAADDYGDILSKLANDDTFEDFFHNHCLFELLDLIKGAGIDCSSISEEDYYYPT